MISLLATAPLLLLLLLTAQAPAAAPDALQAPRTPVPVQDDGAEEPELPEPVREALVALDEAFASRLEAAIVSALLTAGEVDHPRVAESIARGLDHRSSGVRRTAVTALGEMTNDEARLALEAFWRTSDRLERDLGLAERVVRALAAHEHPGSVKLLAELSYEGLDADDRQRAIDAERLLVARIRALGRIRDERSAVELVQILRTMPAEHRAALQADVLLALRVLTGADPAAGSTSAEERRTAWLEWWLAERDRLEIADEVPDLPDALRREWRTYWGLPLEVDRDREEHRRRRG